MGETNRTEEILSQEARRAETVIACFRIAISLLFTIFDFLFHLSGPEKTGYSVPAVIPAVDASYFIVSLAILFYARRLNVLPPQAKYVIISLDYLYLAVYTGFASASGMLDPEMTVGAAGSMALILTIICSLRFSLGATVYGSSLGVAITLGVGLMAGSSAMMAGTMAILAAMIGAIASYLSYRYLQAIRHIVERSRFERFLPKQVVDTMISGKHDIELGGREAEVTVLFTDIRGFTTLCEKMPPLEVLTLLNEYFSAVTAVVFRHEGTLDKYIGDAVMAVFGAPVGDPDDAKKAVRCALDIREVVERINGEREKKQLPRITLGVGLHTGVVVAGTLGSMERMDYTVIGDAVNVASRVEGLTRAVNTDILVTSATAKAAGDGFVFEEAGEINVKGRKEAVKVLKVIGLAP